MSTNRGLEESFPQLDLTGKLIIKVSLGEDIRRIPIHNEDITYDELVLMMQRVFRGKLSSNDEVTVKYRDEVNGQPRPLESDDVKMIRHELQHIRDRVIHLLDRLEPTPVITNLVLNGEESVDEPKAAVPTLPVQKPPVSVAGSKEFDPLSKKRSLDNKVMTSFGISNDANTARPGTPDSVSSIGSSASQQVQQQQQQGQYPGYPQQTPQQQQQQQPYQQGYNQGYPSPQQQGYPSPQGQQTQPQTQPQPQGQPQAQSGQMGTGPQQAGYNQPQQQPAQPQPQQFPPTSAAQVYPSQAGLPQAYSQQGQGQGQQVAQTGVTQPSPPQGTYQANYTPSGVPAGHPTGTNPAQGGNPYSRPPNYNQYPRPQGQYQQFQAQ